MLLSPAETAATQQTTHRHRPAETAAPPPGQQASSRRSATAPPSRRPVDLIGEAYSSRTTRKHVTLLAELESFVSQRNEHTTRSQHHALAVAGPGNTTGPLTLTPAILSDYLEMRRLNPRARTRSGSTCKWSSSRTLFGSVMGALRDAPLHSSRLVMAPNDPSTRKIERTLDHRVFSEKVDFPFAATMAHVETTLGHIDAAPLPTALRIMCKIYLLLWWATAARSGDALLLQEWGIKSMRMTHGRPVHSIKFVEGKGVKLRGPYTVHTLVPHPELLQCLLLESTGYLFPPQARKAIQDAVMSALHCTDPRLEARSIRRGALQALAMADADEETLMTFSGHKCRNTLHRYLDWGMMRGLAQSSGARAALAAWGPLLRRQPSGGSASPTF